MVVLAVEERRTPPVPLVERKAQMSIPMKQMGTMIDLTMKR